MTSQDHHALVEAENDKWREQQEMCDRPMWCDDFDMDLPKVFAQRAKSVVLGLEDRALGRTAPERAAREAEEDAA